MPKVSSAVLFRALIAATIISGFAISASFRSAADDKAPAPQSVEPEKKPVRLPFRGKIHSIDKTAMTITLDGREKKRTIHVTPQTRIAKAGKPAKLEDAVPGEEVGGQAIRIGNGREEAVSLRLGPKPDAKPKAKDDADEEP